MGNCYKTWSSDDVRKILAGDITYLKLGHKFIYLAVVIDLYNREVIGWSMGDSLKTELVLRSLDAAMLKIGPDAEIIFPTVFKI